MTDEQRKLIDHWDIDVEHVDIPDDLKDAYHLLTAELRKTEALLDKAGGALADISTSRDMTLSIARKKAKRVYWEIHKERLSL